MGRVRTPATVESICNCKKNKTKTVVENGKVDDTYTSHSPSLKSPTSRASSCHCHSNFLQKALCSDYPAESAKANSLAQPYVEH